MKMEMENEVKIEERVLILAPTGQDAALACSVLERDGLAGAICEGMARLCSEMKRGAGALLICEEALNSEVLPQLRETLGSQSPWSDIPVIMLTSRTQERKSVEIIKIFGMSGNINLLERTFRPVTLLSVIHAALRARRRQYQVRNLLEQLQESAENLKRSNQELEQFAYISSHDLQEPLRTITSYADLLLHHKQKFDPDTVKCLDYMQEGALHAQELIQGLLGYAGITKVNYPREWIEMDKLLSNALINLRGGIEETGAKIEHGPLPRLNVNPLQITQLFQNLISNAIKYRSDRPSEIRISAREEGAKWIFSVKDNGIGIEAQYKDRIFLIFKRLHSKKEYPGTGIGLAICKKIVEQHSGEIWMESEPGKGTAFHFSLLKD